MKDNKNEASDFIRRRNGRFRSDKSRIEEVGETIDSAAHAGFECKRCRALFWVEIRTPYESVDQRAVEAHSVCE